MNLSQFQLIEQTNTLYKKNTTVLLFNSFLLHSLALATLWQNHNSLALIIWYFTSISLIALRYQNNKNFSKITVSIENYKAWLDKLFILSLLVGTVWGMLFLISIKPVHQFELLVLTTIYFVLISTTSSYLGVYQPAYFAFVLPITILFILKLIIIGGSTNYILSSLLLTYFSFISSLSRNAHFSSRAASKLTYQNNSLFNDILKQKEIADKAVLVKNQFLAAASHDLRQPLHAQGLFVTALEYSELSQDAKILANKIKTSNNALTSLLNGLLDIARLESNAKEYQPKHIALNPIIENINQQYFDLAAENETRLKLKIDNEMYVFSDDYLLSRLITNLVDNSVKFTHKGIILIQTKVLRNKILLTIADTGSGIPENQHKYVFEEFTQLDNSERDRQKGLGLGLSIVKRISNVIDVPIQLKSRIDKGTQFTLTLNRTSQIKRGFKENTSKSKIENYSLIGKTILVIDDDKDILEGMEIIINQWGAFVITAENLKEAIVKLNNKKPDMIISDLRLREGKTGIEAITELRSMFHENISAVLITGDTATERVEMAKKAKLKLLHKPVDTQRLQATINNLINKN